MDSTSNVPDAPIEKLWCSPLNAIVQTWAELLEAEFRQATAIQRLIWASGVPDGLRPQYVLSSTRNFRRAAFGSVVLTKSGPHGPWAFLCVVGGRLPRHDQRRDGESRASP